MCVLSSSETKQKYSWVFCWRIHFSCSELPSTAAQQGWYVIIWLSVVWECLSCLSAAPSRFEDRLGVYRSDVRVEKWNWQQQNPNFSRLTRPDLARRLFVLSAVFCVKPSGLTFRGTDGCWSVETTLPPLARLWLECLMNETLWSLCIPPSLSLRLWFTVCLQRVGVRHIGVSMSGSSLVWSASEAHYCEINGCSRCCHIQTHSSWEECHQTCSLSYF